MNPLFRFARLLRHALRHAKTAVLRRLGLAGGDWMASLPDETRFWASALQDEGATWSRDDFRFRTDPESALQPELCALIDAPEGSIVRILDVGAGPLSTLGKHWPDRALEICAIDPLAAEYDDILSRLRIAPPLRTRVGYAEELDSQFPADSFDLAYSSNALDHSRDPVEAIRQMLRIVKPGHYVYLWHFANEGLEERYTGMHQWNFDIKQGDFLIGDGRSTRSVNDLFGHQARLLCEETRAFGKRVVIAKLQKNAA